MKIKVRSVLIACILTPATAFAQSIVTTWNITFTSRFNYASVTDYGTTTITQFGDVLATTFSSPVTALVGSDPYGGGIAAAYNSYTFPNVSDLSQFVEEFAAQRNTYSLNSDLNRWWSYHIELRATTRTPNRGGTGAADYAFTTDSLLSYLYDFQSGASQATFNESFQLYDQNTNTSIDGFSWSGTGTLLSIAVVPEPSSAGLVVGVAALASCLLAPARRRPNKSVQTRTTSGPV